MIWGRPTILVSGRVANSWHISQPLWHLKTWEFAFYPWGYQTLKQEWAFHLVFLAGDLRFHQGSNGRRSGSLTHHWKARLSSRSLFQILCYFSEIYLVCFFSSFPSHHFIPKHAWGNIIYNSAFGKAWCLSKPGSWEGNSQRAKVAFGSWQSFHHQVTMAASLNQQNLPQGDSSFSIDPRWLSLTI